MTARVRHRQISAERIAKIVEAIEARGLPWEIKLGTDGELRLTRHDSASVTPAPEDDAADEWAKLGIQ